jgi:Asp-tRNA(Asn)/Glu-tRNA(Gln) amidotransferase B subunit
MVHTHDNRAQKALNYLIGEVLKRTGGKADPVVVRRLMIERLQNAP